MWRADEAGAARAGGELKPPDGRALSTDSQSGAPTAPTQPPQPCRPTSARVPTSINASAEPAQFSYWFFRKFFFLLSTYGVPIPAAPQPDRESDLPRVAAAAQRRER